MRINSIIQAFKAQVLQKRTRPEPPESSVSPVRDQVRISPEARALQQSRSDLSLARTALQQVPSARADRVAAARQEIQAGRFTRPEFSSLLADRLLENSSLQGRSVNTADSPLVQARQALVNAPTTRPQRVRLARERVESSFFASRQITGTIADRLLRSFRV